MEYDPQQLGQILDLAGQGSKTLNGALDVAQKVRKLFTKETEKAGDAELKAMIGELAEQLTDARIKNLEVVNMLLALQRDANKEHEFSNAIAAYDRVTLDHGGRVYKLKTPSTASSLWPFICPTCADNERKINPLQGRDDCISFHCQFCKSQFANKQQQVPSHRNRGGNSWTS